MDNQASSPVYQPIDLQLIHHYVVPAPPQSQQAGPSGNDITPIEQELMSKGAFGSASPARDGGGNTFVAYVYNTGFEAYPRMFRHGPLGDGYWEARMPNIAGVANKADSVGILVYDGLLEVWVSSHAVNAGDRIMAIWRGRIEGVAVSMPTAHQQDAPGPDPSKRYFLPNNYVTRGQVAQITKRATGIPAGRGPQHFEDVPEGAPFYEDVQALFADGVITGYRGHE